MASSTPFTNKQVCDFYFKPILDYQDEPTSYYRCRCSKTRKQDIKTGYTNLVSHVRAQHPNFAVEMASSGLASGTLVGFVNKKSQTLYSWIDWIVCCNLPFSFPEDDIVARYTTLPSISTETLVKYLGLLSDALENVIADILPLKFGIVWDGCTFRSQHYVAVFAVFGHDGAMEKILLAMAPLVADDILDHSAPSHVAFLRTILGYYKRTLSAVLYIVADNCSTNGRIAALMKVPFVGCASHRLNLAVVEYMENYDSLLDKVQSLIRKLRGLNASASLRKKTKLRPVLRQATRWSSTFNMIDRYFDLKNSINTLDDEIASLMPTRREENQLKGLLEELKAFESSSKKLQSAEGVSLLDVRDIFDALIAEHPSVAGYLGADAAIVQQPDFEDACVLVLAGKSETLADHQRELLAPFAAPVTQVALVPDPNLGFADRALKARKTLREKPCEYPELATIRPTSNMCERFFSQAKHVLGTHRQGLLPVNFEMVLFLKINRRLWSIKTVANIVNTE